MYTCGLTQIHKNMGFLKTITDNLPLVGMVGDAIQGGLNRRQQRRNLSRQIDWSRESLGLQNSFAREMFEATNRQNKKFWHMKNQYNSPEAQMERFKEAGLNPNLIYGRGSDGAASPVTASAPATPKRDMPDFQAVSAMQMPNLGQYADLSVRMAQKDAIEAQTALTNQRAATEAVNTAIRTNERQYSGLYHQYRMSKMSGDAGKANADAAMKSELAKYSGDLALEAMKKTQLSNAQIAANINLTSERVIGQKIKNDYEGMGLNINTPATVKMAYKRLQTEGFSKKQIREILIGAGVTAEVLKYVLPAGIIGKAFGGKRTREKTRYNHDGKGDYTDVYKYE